MSSRPRPVPGSRSRLGLGLGLGAATLLLVVVVGLALLADRSAGGTPLGELRRGECFTTEKAVIDLKARRVACSLPHTDEVVGVLPFPAGEGTGYPGRDGILELGAQRCGQQESEFLGTRPRSPTARVFVFGPNAEAWKDGERAVVCTLREESGSERSGSYLDG